MFGRAAMRARQWRARGLTVAALAMGGVAALASVGCARRARVEAPPPAPHAVVRATDLIPSELDIVLRIDIGRLKGALGEGALDRTRAAASATEREARLFDAAFSRADTVWLALRPGEGLLDGDRLWVMRGRFADFDASRYDVEPKFERSLDLGGAWRRWDRAAPGERSAPERVYSDGGSWIAFVPSAAVDSVERLTEAETTPSRAPRVSPREPSPWVPPSRGLVAAEARAPVLADVVRKTSPAFARLLARADRVRGYFDLAPARLSLEFELVFPHAEQAERARDATRLLARALAPNRGLVGLFARATRVEAVKGSCVARVELEGYELELFKACLAGGPCEVPHPPSGPPTEAITPAPGAHGSGEPGEPAPNPSSVPDGVP